MTVPWLFSKCFYVYEDTPYRSCLYRLGDAVTRLSVGMVVLCAPLGYFSVAARGGAA